MDRLITLALITIASLSAAPVDRVTAPVDARRVRVVPGNVPSSAKPQYDRGSVDPSIPMESMLLLTRPSPAQQAELNQLLADQQNPASPQFRKWLTPETFGARFGLSIGDHSKLVAWLHSQGFEVKQSGRARNWIRFSGTAGQVENALHTKIHHYELNGEMHFANASPVAVPEALADVIGGFSGLHDFHPKPSAKIITPDFTNGANHFLAPEDFATIYDVTPITAAGIDGTGVNIGIIGGSQILTSDIATFRSKYNLPASVPQTVVVGNNPGTAASAMTEADLDIEWSGAIAPGATVYFYIANNLNNAISGAIDANIVHIISMSFGGSEIDNPTLAFEPILQQGNAQGITLFAATGDSGSAGAPPDSATFARFGPAVPEPSVYPEVTAVGGTQFDDGVGAYWSSTNDANLGSALSYIPEIAWSGGGGGASAIFPKPVWQNAPGVPQDGMRDVPDVSLNAAAHDGYEIVTGGATIPVGGTSCSTPAMAGIVALLNHYLVAGGQLTKPGLGNINPQLYRMAQAFPSAFHDIVTGSNAVTCRDGSPGCASGTFGFNAGPGYDQATGIGSLDVNNFITQWTSSTNAVYVTFSVSPAKGTFNDTFQLSATVTPSAGSAIPTGVVNFSSNGTVALGSAALDSSSGQAVATLSVPGYQFVSLVAPFPQNNIPDAYSLTATYGGDPSFSIGGATSTVQIAAPAGVSSIVPLAPVSIAAIEDPLGLSWLFTVTLTERGGVAATVTGVNFDGQDQPVSQFFATPNIPAKGSLAGLPVTLRNLAYPQMHMLIFSGVDANGQTWSVQTSITFLGPRTVMQTPQLTAIPLVIQQDPTAPPNCQWSQQVFITEFSGYPQTLSSLMLGNTALTPLPATFGTAQLAPYSMLHGAVCWTGASAGTTSSLTAKFGNLSQTVAVSFAGPATTPAPVSVTPSTVSLSTDNPQAAINISVPDGQSWTIAIEPQNVTSGWLTLSQMTGTGSAQITATASGSGFTPDAYLAKLVIQGPNLSPASLTVPITFLNGDSDGVTISSVTNAASGQSVAAPGMMAILQGSNLPGTGIGFPAGGFGFAPNQVLVTVNGVPAAIGTGSNSQLAFQIPYETSVGPAVVGVSFRGKVGGYPFQTTPAAPGLFTDANGSVGTVQAGKSIAIKMTGDGVTTPALADGGTPGPGSNLAIKPFLPFTLTIGGVAANLTSYGVAAGDRGTTTMNVAIPATATAGVQQVIVTVNRVPSPPASINITAAP